jgi:hypothetical protein
MKIENRNFILLLIIATIMVFGAIAENIRSVSIPAEVKIEINISPIKNKIQEAGITPHNAMHWKEL